MAGMSTNGRAPRSRWAAGVTLYAEMKISTKAVEDRMRKHMATALHLHPLALTQLIITYYLVKASALAARQEAHLSAVEREADAPATRV